MPDVAHTSRYALKDYIYGAALDACRGVLLIRLFTLRAEGAQALDATHMPTPNTRITRDAIAADAP